MFYGLEGWICIAFLAWAAAIVLMPPQSKAWHVVCASILPFVIPLAVFIVYCMVPIQPLTSGHPLSAQDRQSLNLLGTISFCWFPLTLALLYVLRKLCVLVVVSSVISGALTFWIWVWANMAISGTWL